MKNLVWFVFGVAGGLVAAHLLNKDPRGHEILAEVDARITEFTDRMSDAYREQEARFGGLVDAAQGAASGAVGVVKDAASDVIDAAKDAASGTVDVAADAAKKLTD